MNPLGIISLVIAVIVGYFAFSGQREFGGGPGPIATGSRSPEIQNPQPVSSGGFFFTAAPPSAANRAVPSPPRPGESPFHGLVRITTIQRFSDRPEEEYLAIRYQQTFSSQSQSSLPPRIDVTGWRISSIRRTVLIPRAFNIPEIDVSEQDILLPPGGELIVVTGMPDYTRNFRENQCVGYLGENLTFMPSLPGSCPGAYPDRSELLARGFNGACIDTIQAIGSCRRPRGPFQAGVIGSACIDYMFKNFSYAGCVKNFRDRRDFLRDTWRVSLKLLEKIYDSRHDRIELRDQNGRLVDTFEY